MSIHNPNVRWMRCVICRKDMWAPIIPIWETFYCNKCEEE